MSENAEKMLRVLASGGQELTLNILYSDNKEKFDNTKCYRCKSVCCKDTTPLPIDLLKKHNITGDNVVHRILYPDGNELPAPKGHLFVLNSESGKCVFLESGKCKIYDERPIFCKCYPISLWDNYHCNGVSKHFLSNLKIDTARIEKGVEELIRVAEKDGFYIGDVKIEVTDDNRTPDNK